MTLNVEKGIGFQRSAEHNMVRYHYPDGTRIDEKVRYDSVALTTNLYHVGRYYIYIIIHTYARATEKNHVCRNDLRTDRGGRRE